MTTPPVSWSTAPRSLVLDVNHVHVWCAGLAVDTSGLDHMFQLLSEDERDRSERFRFRRDRDRFIAAHGLLRVILARYLNVEADTVRFLTNPSGKPFLKPSSCSEKIRFNMSHSQELCLYAFSRDREIGVDLEFIRPIDEIGTIARQFFSPQEIETLLTLPGERQREAFYNCWTR